MEKESLREVVSQCIVLVRSVDVTCFSSFTLVCIGNV